MSTAGEKSSGEGWSDEAVVQVITAPTVEDEEYFPDGGFRAWLVVAGCFVITAVTVGFW